MESRIEPEEVADGAIHMGLRPARGAYLRVSTTNWVIREDSIRGKG